VPLSRIGLADRWLELLVLRAIGCIDRGELRSALTCVGEQTDAAKSSPQIDTCFIDWSDRLRECNCKAL
jgi:hypothetical protein